MCGETLRPCPEVFAKHRFHVDVPFIDPKHIVSVKMSDASPRKKAVSKDGSCVVSSITDARLTYGEFEVESTVAVRPELNSVAAFGIPGTLKSIADNATQEAHVQMTNESGVVRMDWNLTVRPTKVVFSRLSHLVDGPFTYIVTFKVLSLRVKAAGSKKDKA